MRVAEAAAAVLLCAGLLAVILWPTPVDRPLYGRLVRFLNRLHEMGFPVISYSWLEGAANVALFIPIGFLAARLLAPRRWWLALALCMVLSGAGELAQALFLPARNANAQDVLLNDSGALAGVGLAGLLAFAVRRKP
ncbi:hypothetical protein AO716_07715 [Arthrobacter sp. Edens01]|nr:hypothetical protein AO716_07715 [Arthrobacter sp. Edens01]